jgi:adenine-specific DNA-methyltransferase
MTTSEAKKLIEYVFTHKFQPDYFEKFISNIFKEYSPLDISREGQSIKDAFKPHVVKYKIIGSFVDAENNNIDILFVALNNINTLQRARTLQRNFVADYLNSNGKEAALVAFITNKDEWRFSLVKLDHSLEVVDEKIKTKKEITPARRWSFLVGKNEGSHTAQSRFIKLLTDNEKPNLAELESAFNIESVTKEFFDRYTQLYFGIKEHLDSLLGSSEKIKKDFEEKEISTVDFAKKTLGQIVFLYFLQKKGWFGVASNKEWGSGPKNFLRELFNRRENYGKNFFNDILEPLFYDALAQDRGEGAIYPKLNNVRMPFLNGGLFEPMNNYQWETTDITIPDELFSNEITDTKTGDVGNGILDVFDRYNFTVNENEPLEKEVAVDPEMLGKVFENLLEIKDRKSKGAFYTPREIVHYMCQEALINYLETEANDIPRDNIEFFIRRGELILENDKITAEKIAEKEDRGYEYKGVYSYLLPQSIIDSATDIDKLLYNIKVADPAVGSGAFPLGMLNEIVRARRVIGIHTKNNKKVYTLKKETISNSLYGVDIDPGAVEIAKLRLWLSLVVDENKPHPLPNLDHKIMQGNSLISEYEGIKLFDEKILEKEDIPTQYSLPFDKDELEVKMGDLQSKTKQYISESHRTDKSKLKKEIDELKWNLIETSLRRQGSEDKIEKISKLRRKNIKPFFAWKLEFADVFKNKGGFDVVIGNPPYVKEYTDKKAFDGLRKSPYYMGKMDLWYFFGCYGIDLLKNRGIQVFIAPNNWISNFGAKLIRDKILNEAIIKQFLDFGNYKVFDTAGIQTMVYVLEKNKQNTSYQVQYGRLDIDKPNHNNLNLFLNSNFKVNNNLFEKYSFSFNKSDFDSDGIQFSNPVYKKVIDSIQKGENIFLTKSEVAQGIVMPQDFLNKKNKEKLGKGYEIGDGIFILSEKEKNNLDLSDHEISLVKPYFMTPNFYKYGTIPINSHWIIYTDSKFNNPKEIESYPSLKQHLDKYKDIITSDNKPYGLHRARNEKFFNGGKIVVARKCIEPSFSYNNIDCYVSATFYVIKSDRINLKYLTTLLNSHLIRFWLKHKGKMQGDNFQIDKAPLLLIPIKKAAEQKEKYFIDLFHQIIEITSESNYDPKNPPEKQKQLEAKIDEMVMDLYELTEEEKEVVRNS